MIIGRASPSPEARRELAHFLTSKWLAALYNYVCGVSLEIVQYSYYIIELTLRALVVVKVEFHKRNVVDNQ